jgi:hypothetical protein
VRILGDAIVPVAVGTGGETNKRPYSSILKVLVEFKLFLAGSVLKVCVNVCGVHV